MTPTPALKVDIIRTGGLAGDKIERLGLVPQTENAIDLCQDILAGVPKVLPRAPMADMYTFTVTVTDAAGKTAKTAFINKLPPMLQQMWDSKPAATAQTAAPAPVRPNLDFDLKITRTGGFAGLTDYVVLGKGTLPLMTAQKDFCDKLMASGRKVYGQQGFDTFKYTLELVKDGAAHKFIFHTNLPQELATLWNSLPKHNPRFDNGAPQP